VPWELLVLPVSLLLCNVWNPKVTWRFFRFPKVRDSMLGTDTSSESVILSLGLRYCHGLSVSVTHGPCILDLHR